MGQVQAVASPPGRRPRGVVWYWEETPVVGRPGRAVCTQPGGAWFLGPQGGRGRRHGPGRGCGPVSERRGPVVREECCAIKIYLLPAPLTESDFDSGTDPKSISLSPSVSASAVTATEAAALWRAGRRRRRRTAPDSPPWFACLLCSLARVPATPPPRPSCAPRP